MEPDWPFRRVGLAGVKVSRMDRPGWKRWLKSAVKTTVAVLVLWAVGRHVLRTWGAIKEHEVAVRIQPGWLVASGFFYLAGLACSGRFYGEVLRAGTPPIGMAPAMRAYLISHLGKYVPGKAMVVVMRRGFPLLMEPGLPRRRSPRFMKPSS